MPYFHLVFTLPHALNPLAQANPKLIYTLLFHAASQTLLEFGRNPRWLGGEIGITMVLHTWGQKLDHHIHLHCVVTGGALSPDGQHWLPASEGFLFPVQALSRVFRGKYLESLAQAYAHQQLRLAGSVAHLAEPEVLHALLATLSAQDWVVYAKRPFAGPEQVLAYLGRYTHRVAIANHRYVQLLELDSCNIKKIGNCLHIIIYSTSLCSDGNPLHNTALRIFCMMRCTASCAVRTRPEPRACHRWPGRRQAMRADRRAPTRYNRREARCSHRCLGRWYV